MGTSLSLAPRARLKRNRIVYRIKLLSHVVQLVAEGVVAV